MKKMNRRNLMVRLARALSGMSQRDFAWHVGIDYSTLADYERGETVPRSHLEQVLAGADLTVEEAEEHLRLWESRRARRLRQGRGAEDILAEIEELSRFDARIAHERLQRLPLPASAPKPEDRLAAREQVALLEQIPREHRVSAVQVSRDLQNWALCEATADRSWQWASRDLREARVWARVAREIAARVDGEEGWCKRLKGFANAHEPNVLRVEGELDAADAGLEPAKRLWLAGSDPDRLLEPGRLLDFEGALRRDQRRFPEALSLFDRSRAVSRYPARPLVQKGFTYEVMGEYEPAIATLLEAEPYLDKQADPRLWYQQRSQKAVCYTHLGCFREAAELIKEARPLAIELGDQIALVRLTWLDGRVAAGQGRREEALSLLGEARQQFEDEGMWYDVALALLEEGVLLLDLGRTAEVKALAPELAKVFKSKKLHREAQAALQLFQEAVERDKATAALARRVLRFLFRARHDKGLQFK
jgi:tetratricopeptide (TPR) repeat protein